MVELMGDVELMATNSFGREGSSTARAGAHRGHGPRWTACWSAGRGGHGRSSRRRPDLPVNLGGYRDHGPLGTRMLAGARTPTRRLADRFRWRRE
eukprot:2275736-Pyramimonas_sp.AAC.1